MVLGLLPRYRPLVDDWDALVASLGRPLPTTFWHHRLRIGEDALRGRLRRLGLAPEPIDWCPGAWRLPVDDPSARAPSLGASVEWLAGLVQIQEEAALAPVRLLAPRPGERILDLCAAPGNKTVRAALAMEDRGTIVAVDSDPWRLGILHRTIQRMGWTSIVTRAFDGSSLPREFGLFDGVLVDVPCSCEGTVRKHPRILARAAAKPVGWRAGVQKALLRKAIQLCRPGGRIVYSTCTFAPEENEAVVDAALREWGRGVVLEEAGVPGLWTDPGLRSFGDHTWDASMDRTRRLWPHHNDTGGFFVALLRRTDERARPLDSADAERPPEELPDARSSLAHLREAFGLEATVFVPYRLIAQSDRIASLVSRSVAFSPAVEPGKLGLPLFRLDAETPIPTSSGARWLAERATRRVVELEDHAVEDFARGRDVPISTREDPNVDGAFRLVRNRGLGLGKGLLVRTSGGTVLRPQVTRAWRRHTAESADA